jgi:hypothetical protein
VALRPQYMRHPDFPSVPVDTPLTCAQALCACLSVAPSQRPSFAQLVVILGDVAKEIATGRYVNSAGQSQACHRRRAQYLCLSRDLACASLAAAPVERVALQQSSRQPIAEMTAVPFVLVSARAQCADAQWRPRSPLCIHHAQSHV